MAVSDQCKTSDAAGLCSTCFKGYDLKDGKCIFSDFNNAKPSDSGCAKWNWDSQTCLECSKGWAFNADKICVAVSDQCKTYDAAGRCLSCFKGYDLKDGACVFSSSNTAKPIDSGCAKWDWEKQVCLECSKGFVFKGLGLGTGGLNKICVAVKDQCKSYNDSGACTSCFKGYDLIDGICEFSSFNSAKPADLGCAKWDWDNQKCLECSKNWAFNSNKVCVPVSDQCKTHDTNGLCLSCFKGYDLKNGSCVFSDFNNAKPSDLGCAKWDWDNQVCISCSNGWVFNANKVCVAVSDQCKTSDAAGLCLTCFKGYELKDGKCVSSSFNTAKPSDLGCAKWDWDNQVCIECSNNWVFSTTGVCVPINDQCKTSDPSGACASCFKGYDLTEGKCIFSSFNNAKPSDSGCSKWDWDNQVCIECSKNYAFNTNKICVPVSDQCKTHDNSGACTSCFKGYDLKDGTCTLSSFNNAKPADSGCGKWDWDNQKCLECSKGWVFNA